MRDEWSDTKKGTGNHMVDTMRPFWQVKPRFGCFGIWWTILGNDGGADVNLGKRSNGSIISIPLLNA